MNYWKSNGVPAEKLLVGFATYGHNFILASSNTAVGAPASGPGAAGPFTRQAGIWAYYEVGTLNLCECMNVSKGQPAPVLSTSLNC